ncbi:MAG: hypothetical protein WD715_13230 [Dongiaceae bacterium]
MRTIDQYLDLAKARQGIESDRQLSAALGLSGPGVCIWRTRRAWPKDEAMIRLSTLAGIDQAEGLLDLNQWRVEGTAQTVYREMARRLAGTAAMLLFALGVTLGSGNDAIAGTNAAQVNALCRYTVYYGKYKPWLVRCWAGSLEWQIWPFGTPPERTPIWHTRSRSPPRAGRGLATSVSNNGRSRTGSEFASGPVR